MAIATQQILNDGPRNLVLKYTFGGDLNDSTAEILLDADAFSIEHGGLRLERAQWSLTGMSCNLSWEDGATDVDLIEMNSGYGEIDFSESGGVVNNATLQTGNVVFTTTGYGTAGDGGSFVLEFKKKSSSALTGHDPDVPLGSLTLTGLVPVVVNA